MITTIYDGGFFNQGNYTLESCPFNSIHEILCKKIWGSDGEHQLKLVKHEIIAGLNWKLMEWVVLFQNMPNRNACNRENKEYVS